MSIPHTEQTEMENHGLDDGRWLEYGYREHSNKKIYEDGRLYRILPGSRKGKEVNVN